MNANYLTYGNKYSFLIRENTDFSHKGNCGCGSINSKFVEYSEQTQQANKSEIQRCVTISCCGIGFLSVEVWVRRICVTYTSSRSISLGLYPNIIDREIEVLEDVLLGIRGKNEEGLILPKGRYFVEKNQITFTPLTLTKAQVSKYCVTLDITGETWGQKYEYHLTVCVWIINNSRMGVVEIEPNLSSSQLSQLYISGNREITFNRDSHICDKSNDIDFNLKAGNYYVNDDGKIYLQHVKVR